VTEARTRLAEVLAAIRANQQAGMLTVHQAADKRIAALEAHLAECEEHRRRYLGED